MNTEITPEQIESYQRDGFLFLGEFLTEDELEALRHSVAECLQKMGTTKVAGDEAADLKAGDSYYDRVFVQKVNLWKINDEIRAFFLSPALGEMLCKLAGTTGIRIWHDQTLQKQPWANPTAWHLDNPYWSFHSRRAISIWIALDDATLQNGCMYYLPGSHRIVDYKNVEIDVEMGALFQTYPKLRNIEAVPIQMRAGMAAVHNGLTAHAAGPNMTPYWRRAMTCAFMPEGSSFNGIQNILSEKQVARLKVGDLLDDESQNPLIWSSLKAG